MSINKGELLKQLRKNYNYTLDEVGEKIGVSKQTLYKYENNIITNIPSAKIEALAKIYNTSPAYIMGWEDHWQDTSTDEGYYTATEVAELAEAARINPDLRVLFSASKKLSKESMKKTLEYIKFLKAQESNDSDFSE